MSATATYTVLPFLRQAGINHLDWAIAPRLPKDYPDGWAAIFRNRTNQNALWPR